MILLLEYLCRANLTPFRATRFMPELFSGGFELPNPDVAITHGLSVILQQERQLGRRHLVRADVSCNRSGPVGMV